MNRKLKMQQKDKGKKKQILSIAILFIFILNLFSIIFHFLDSDNQDKMLKEIQAKTDIKLTKDKSNSKAEQDQKIAIFKEKQFIPEEYLSSKQIEEIQKNEQYYDFLSLITSFQLKSDPKLIQYQYGRTSFKRNMLNIQLSNGLLDKMFHQIAIQNKNDKHINYQKNKKYFQILYNNPNNEIYRQLQYYYYNKVYNIGNFGFELPLCVVLYGRNNQMTIKQNYESIRRQNYTNYKVIYMDDNSRDESINKALQYLENYKDFKHVVTIIKQNYQRNKLFNIHYGISNYCENNDVIIQMNANQFLIGQQVFQLINTLYHPKKQHQVWSVYTGSIGCQNKICPLSAKQIQLQKSKNYPGLSVPRLRTYLKKIYLKIDSKDFLDAYMVKKGQFFATYSQLFIYQRILQMGGQKHVLKIQESPYLYQNARLNYSNIEQSYSLLSFKILYPYKPLKSLGQSPTRLRQLEISKKKLRKYELVKQNIKQKRLILKNKIKQLYEESITNYKSEYFNFIQERVIYNKIKTNNTAFGQSPDLFINVSSLFKISNNFTFKDYGIYDNIQVCSNYDFFNLTNIINFTTVKKRLAEQAFHQILTFKFNQKLQKSQEKINISHFSNYFQVQAYLNSSNYFNSQKKFIRDEQFFISSLLALPKITQQLKQLEYFRLNKKYNIQNDFQQIPICVISGGYNFFSQKKYKNLIYSLEKMNYTNFKILWVDDNSADHSAYNLYKYLKNTNLRIKNKIKIIRNFQHMGILANIHIYTQKYCGQDDIVIICDSKDEIIGIQTFHLLSSIFKNLKNWYVQSRFLKSLGQQKNNMFAQGRSSNKLDFSLQQYRTKGDFSVGSHMKIFRRKVLDKVPIQHLIEYKYSQKQQMAWPIYYQASADSFYGYSCLQLTGNDRAIFIDDILYKQNIQTPQSCDRYKQLFQFYKSKLKRKLRPLQSLQSEVMYQQNSQTPKKVLEKLKEYNKMYLQCSQ